MIEPKIHLVKTEQEFNRLVTYTTNIGSPYLVLDTETDTEIEKTAKLYGIGLCFNDKRGFYIPWRRKDGSKVWSDEMEAKIVAWLKDLCSRKKVVGHNIIFDILVLENNLDVFITNYIYSDTILLKHTLDEERPFGLKEVAVAKLGNWADKAQQKLKDSVLENGGRWTEDHKDMYLADTDILGEYCVWDCLLTYMLFVKFENKLMTEGLSDLFYKEEVMPLYKKVTIDMKRRGFPVDLDHYRKLDDDIKADIDKLEDEIVEEIEPEIDYFIQGILDKKHPVKAGANCAFPKVLAEVADIPMPVNKKTGKITTAKGEIEKYQKQHPEHNDFYEWIIKGTHGWLATSKITQKQIRKAQEVLFFRTKANEGKRFIYNLNSSDHLSEFFHKVRNNPVTARTDTGKPKIDADLLEAIGQHDNVAAKILDFKKLNKLRSTYIIGILKRQVDGYIYTSMLQFGTTSGRYSSTNPNLQNQPRIKDDESGLSKLVLFYTNEIRKGFIAPPGFKIVNADFSQLEPCCFAHMSGDPKLQAVFKKGEDLYSRIAIDVFKLKNVSADKRANNYLKKVSPEFRQKAKVFCLAVVYGAGISRIKDAMKVDAKEANRVIRAYLSTYPNLKKYMNSCDHDAKFKGRVKTIFGRIRHLPGATNLHTLYGRNLLDYKWARANNLTDQRFKLKNLLNNAKNFPIQGLAAHIVNRSMIAMADRMAEHNIEGWIGLQVHDEITCIVREDQAELASNLLQEAMEKTTTISVPLRAEPLVADCWGDAK